MTADFNAFFDTIVVRHLVPVESGHFTEETKNEYFIIHALLYSMRIVIRINVNFTVV